MAGLRHNVLLNEASLALTTWEMRSSLGENYSVSSGRKGEGEMYMLHATKL